MSRSFAELCAWAARLTPRDVPPDVSATVRAQLVGLAGSERRLRELPAGAACGDGAIGQTARLLRYHYDDHQLGGRVGAGLGPAAFLTRSGTLDELVATCAAAGEVGARAGLAGALSHRSDAVDSRPMRAAAAVVAARAQGAGPEQVEAAVAGALAAGGPAPIEELGRLEGVSALARSIHEARGGAGAESGLPEAWGAAGAVWLARTLVIPRFPGSVWANVALDALDEVLGRHLKAAEKRLRAEQIERIELRTAWGGPGAAPTAFSAPALGAWSLPEAFGLLLAHHELGPELLEVGASGDKADEVAHVAARVQVVEDWRLSLRKARTLSQALGPVLGSAGLRAALSAGRGRVSGPPDAAQLGALLGEAPWATLAGLRRRGGLAACTLDQAQSWPVELKLYTTRGGWWPERRSAPSGTGPGLRAAALARYAGPGAALLDAPGDRPAADWIQECLS